MAMEDLMKALMEAGAQSQQPAKQQQSAGGDMLSQVLGGLLGGQQTGGSQQSAGGDLMGQVLGGLLGGQQQAAMPQQQPASSGDALLGALEGIIGGRPGTGQALPMNQGGLNLGASNSPIMGLLQPVVNQLAAKANISPQIATVVASIALHYLLSSHPSTSPRAPLDLGSVMQQVASGNVSRGVMQNSGMVNDVMQATGLSKQQAVKSLDTTFNTLGAHVHGSANLRRSATS